MSEDYKPGGCAIIFGVIAIIFGIFVMLAAPPLTIVPGLAAIGGGLRLMTGSGSL